MVITLGITWGLVLLSSGYCLCEDARLLEVSSAVYEVLAASEGVAVVRMADADREDFSILLW